MQSSWRTRGLDQQSNIVSLQSAKRKKTNHRHLGALLREIRQDAGVSQEAVSMAFEQYSSKKTFSELGLHWPIHRGAIQPLSDKQYGKIERNQKPPWFNQILPLYLAMTAGCGIAMIPEERNEFIELARQKIETKVGQYRENLAESDWVWLEEQLCTADGDLESGASHMQICVLEIDEERARLREENQERLEQEQRAKILADLAIDTSHIIGREAWLEQMLSYTEQQTTSRKKAVIIQAMMGVGKTSGLKLLQKHLLEDTETCRIIYHEFKQPVEADAPAAREEKTPAEHLDLLLAHVLNELQPEQAERNEAPALKKQIRLVLEAICRLNTRLVILLDDAQVLLEQTGELYPGWQQFLNELIEHDHRTTLFVATREWPGWTERKDSYLVQTEMELLSSEACIRLWKNLGFGDEEEAVLQKATALCANNPRMIEIVAQNVGKPIYTFGWSPWQKVRGDDELQGLAQFTEEPHYLSSAILDAYPLLDEVISTRLSSDARQLLLLLAVAPVSLSAPLLASLTQHPKRCIKDLTRTSLLARDPERLRLLPLVIETVLQHLSQDEKRSIEEQVIEAYQRWMQQGSYLDEQEQASVIAELAILYLRHHRLLEAAELVLNHGWLLYACKHARRIARVADASIRILQCYSEENEIGSLLLRLRLMRYFKKDWTDSQVRLAYLQLYEGMCHGHISFKPRAALYIIHHRLLSLIEQKCYSEASFLINEEYHRHETLRKIDPVTFIELLDHRAFVAGRWGDYLEAQGERERVCQLRQEAVAIHLQCVEQLRRYEYFAPPLLQSHILYQKARMLHDVSFYERCLGDENALVHIEECLSLKEAGYATKGSLAVTYDDYAHLLAKQGKYQQALSYSERAVQLTQQRMVDAKLSAGPSQMGMLLVNRGKLLLQLKRFDEAQTHFQTGKALVEGTSRHTLSFPAAENGLRSIQEQRRVNPRGHLDHQWFSRYRDLSSYSDVKWLTPAGLFSPEEQQEWVLLSKQRGEEANNRLSKIIARSQERELTASFHEQREPHFHYPFIPLEEIAEKGAGFSTLRTEIEQQEENGVVRQLYLDVIDERLNELGMIAATGKQDDEAFWLYSQRLYAVPNVQEMELAIRPLTYLLYKGLRNSATSDLALHIIRQAQNWSIDPMSLKEEERELDPIVEEHPAPVSTAHKYFSSEIAKRFFEDVFQRYQFAWTVILDSAASHPRVSLTDKQLVLPEGRQISVTKIREILAHEIEMHVFRSVAGEKSRLLLLSLGLANFLETEEGLAAYYSQEAARFGAAKPNKTWSETLSTGLAAGVVCQPFSFHTLRSFLVQVFTLRLLLATHRKTSAEIQEDALKNAQKRCLRTWRGVSNLAHAGICATKDSVYLRGYLAVRDTLQQDPGIFDRLLVGSVGVQHLGALSELGITNSHVVHRRLACSSDLESSIAQCSNDIQRNASAERR